MKLFTSILLTASVDLSDKYARQEFIEGLESQLSEIQETNEDESAVHTKLNTLKDMIRTFQTEIEDTTTVLTEDIKFQEDAVMLVQSEQTIKQNTFQSHQDIIYVHDGYLAGNTTLLDTARTEFQRLTTKKADWEQKILDAIKAVDDARKSTDYFKFSGANRTDVCTFKFDATQSLSTIRQNFMGDGHVYANDVRAESIDKREISYFTTFFGEKDTIFDAAYNHLVLLRSELVTIKSDLVAAGNDYKDLISIKNEELVHVEYYNCAYYKYSSQICHDYFSRYKTAYDSYHTKHTYTIAREQQNKDDIHNLNLIYCHIDAYISTGVFRSSESSLDYCTKQANKEYALDVTYQGVTARHSCTVYDRKEYCDC